MSASIENLRKALQFLDTCRAEPATATVAGSWGDARRWIEEAARAVVAESDNQCDHRWSYFGDQPNPRCDRCLKIGSPSDAPLS